MGFLDTIKKMLGMAEEEKTETMDNTPQAEAPAPEAPAEETPAEPTPSEGGEEEKTEV